MSALDQQKVSLEQWVNDHEKLLTVSGVFGALTAYFSQLSGYARYLAFFSLVLFLILAVEAYFTFPWSRASDRLYYFAVSFGFLVMYASWYFVQIYWRPLLSSRYSYLWMSYVYATPIVWVFKKIKLWQWARNYEGRHKWNRLIVNLGLFALFVALIAILSYGSAQLIRYMIPSLGEQ